MISADGVTVVSGKDINVVGSNVVGSNSVSLAAKGDVNILAATETYQDDEFHDVKHSGLSGSGGIGFSVGSSEQKDQYNANSVTQSQARSSVGAVQGNVVISAGKDVHIGGSDIVAGKAKSDVTAATGNIAIVGQNVTIDPSQDTAHSHDQQDARSSGLTVGVTGTPLDAVRDARANASSGTAYQRAQNTLNGIGASAADTPSISVSYGRSQSSSTTDVSSLTNAGSTIRGGGNVSVTAAGGAVKDANGQTIDGDLSIIGSTISAGGTATLAANRNVTLQASTDQLQQSSQSSSSSMGISLASPGLGDLTRWVSGTANSGGTNPSPYNASRNNANGTQAQSTQTATVVSGNSVIVKSNTGDINVIGSGISGTQGVDLVASQGAINVLAGRDTNTNHQESSGQRIGSLGSNGTSTGFSVGVSNNHSVQDSAAQTQSTIRSQIVSGKGSVSLDANQDVTIAGADVSASKDLTLIGRNVNLDPGLDAMQNSMSQSSSQFGVTLALGGAVGNAIATVNQSMNNASHAGDARLVALDTAQAGLAVYNAYKVATATNPSQQALIKATVSIGGGSSSSESQSSQVANDGSTLHAGGTVNVVATGSGAKDANGIATDGDINSRGTQISGQNVVLNAARDINLQSAQDTNQESSHNSSSGGSIGVGAALGGQQNGFTIELAANTASGHANGNGATNRDTQISATDKLTVTSGRDTNVRGAEVSGNTVVVNVGRDLNIASQQDTNTYDSKQTSGGFQVSLCIPPICYGTTAQGSASFSDQTIKDRFQSVNQQSGFFAGDGGYNINVGNHTQLDGGAIASTATADKNSLSTQTLGFSNLENHAEYSGSTIGFSASGGFGKSTPEGVNWNTPVKQTANNTSSSQNSQGLGPSGFGMAGTSDSASGTTYAAVSPGTITVRGDAGTGHDSTAGLSRDTANANGSVQNTFDARKVGDDMAVQQGAVQVGMQVAGDIAGALQDSARKKMDDANGRLKAAQESGDTAAEQQARADLQAAQSQYALWGNEGAGRIGAHAIVAGVGAALGGGNVLGAVGGTIAGDIASNAVTGALPDTLGTSILSNIAAGAAGATLGGALGGTGGAMSGANGALGADLYNRQLHQTEIDAIRAKAKQLADAGVTSYDDALQRLSSQALRDVDLQYATSHPGGDVQAQAWLDQVKSSNPAGYGNMPLFQATRDQYQNSGLNADTKSSNPDIYTAANRPPLPGTISPTGPTLSALVTGPVKAAGNTVISVYNAALGVALGSEGTSLSWPPIPMSPDEAAAAQAVGAMALPFGLLGKSGTSAEVVGAPKTYAGGGATLVDDAQFLLGERQLPRATGVLSGDAELPPLNAPADQVRSIARQNEAAEVLADHGLNVEQLPNTGKPGANPDIKINGQVADIYSPTSGNLQTIRDTVTTKVNTQASNVVINLADSPLTDSQVAQYLQRNPVAGLTSVTLIKNGVVTVIGK
ncbi:hemagglutinin repeat-containing protein [Paraburkholderia sp. D15]|uniref:hemagglutinin repeat-containing protein n=1 Tax=Paraburkholderia sp. D15 TaxID=2880218 RepID=UPI002479724E|nr:hemagglutinin repeat-containing protein [Paraburkholderia sp. D15]WGS49992.1 hemagglutinin repeat-containing protein [Paraburkholderia sp. D15]